MPRVGLTRERVLDAAQAIADEGGLEALDLTALADRVNVRKPSLYKHVDGLPDIHAGLAERCFEGLADTVVGSADLADVARRWRRFAHAHPGLYAAGIPAARSTPAADRALSALLARLAALGLDGDHAIDAARALRALVHGFVALERAGGFGLPSSVDASFDRAVQALIVGLGAPSSADADR